MKLEFDNDFFYCPKDHHKLQFRDLSGENYVLCEPIHTSEISRILKFSKINRLPILVKNGEHGSNPKNCSQHIIINMTNFKNISTSKDNSIRAESAVTVEELSKYLLEQKYFLPLPENQMTTVGSTFASSNIGAFPINLGKLSDYVVGVTGYDSKGKETWIVEEGGVVENVELKKLSFHEFQKKKLFVTFSDKLVDSENDVVEFFSKLIKFDEQIQGKKPFDVYVHISNHKLPLIEVRVAGYNQEIQEAYIRFLLGSSSKFKTTQNPKEILTLMQRFRHEGTFRFPECQPRTVTKDVSSLKELKETVDIVKDLFKAIRPVRFSVKKTENGWNSEVMMYEQKEYFDVLKSLDLVSKMEKVKVKNDISNLFEFVITTAKIKFSKSEKSIPGFQGKIVAPNSREYESSNDTYARYSSTYSDDVKRKRMQPLLLVYPTSVQDITVVVKYAKANNLKVVVRSGGHQYCGLSSGSSNTIVVKMDAFDKIEKLTGTDKPRIALGPCAQLKNVTEANKKFGVTLPHGECPLVCIGGHAQSGGFGHFIRNFGLFLDYIYQLEVVTASGDIKTLVRNGNDKDLFAGICGGGPGSFAILTKIIIEPVEDKNYPESGGFSKVYRYNKELLDRGLKEIQKWTQLERLGRLPDGIDMNVTVFAAPFDRIGILPDLFIFEATAQSKAGMDIIFKMKEEVTKGFSPIPLVPSFEGKKALSEMNHNFTRRAMEYFGRNGREFVLPYEKRYQCTKDPLTEGCVTNMAGLIDRTLKIKGIKLVFQTAGLGGGQYKRNSFKVSGREFLNTFSHRDVSIGFVFDNFYQEGFKNAALENQKEFDRSVKPLLGRKDIRMQWGSFGSEDELTMANQRVQEMYYDDASLYLRLQNLKKKWDPQNIFYTQFTVTLPRFDSVKESNEKKDKEEKIEIKDKVEEKVELKEEKSTTKTIVNEIISDLNWFLFE